jgi:predicted Zn-dependent protease
MTNKKGPVEAETETKTEVVTPAKKVAKAHNITITEVTRNTSAGRFSYATFNGRTARRAFRRGRPHYELVAGITIGSGDKPTTREISSDSQLGKLLTEEK